MDIYDGYRKFGKLGFQSRWEMCLDEGEQRVHHRTRRSAERPAVLRSKRLKFEDLRIDIEYILHSHEIYPACFHARLLGCEDFQ